MGVHVQLIIEAPRGLQDLESAARHYECRIEATLAEIATPRSNRLKNEMRYLAIIKDRASLASVRALQLGMAIAA
jgi:hypothetical protein